MNVWNDGWAMGNLKLQPVSNYNQITDIGLSWY